MSAVEHEHDWVTQLGGDGRPPSFGACTVCHELPPALCAVCGDPTPSSVPIHDACLQREHDVLDDIATVVAAWPEPIREILTATSYDISGVTAVDDAARLPFGLDAVTDDWYHQAAGVRTVPGALELVAEWANAWRDAGAGEPDGGRVAYLRSRIVWAATNPERSGFEDYRREIRTVAHQLHALTGDLPERVEGARCLTCGGTLARHRAVDPDDRRGVLVLDDVATCERCGDRHDLVRIGRALQARIALVPDAAPDSLVTEPEARRLFTELHPATIRKWIQRGRLTATGTRRGSATYRVADIDALARPRHTDATSTDAVAG